MIRILTVIGARPQFIKAAALSARIRQLPDFEEVIVHTGQHYDQNMSRVFFEELGLPSPKYLLQKPDGNNLVMIAHQLLELNKIIQKERPDYLLVYGDTDSTLAGAIAANKNRVKLVHVESGLRSFNTNMPEENNRKLTDCVSDILFTTDEIAQNNLKFENVVGQEYCVGDIMLETLLLVQNSLDISNASEGYVVATFHRPSNVDDQTNLHEIMEAMAALSLQKRIIIPAHPRSRKNIENTLASITGPDANIEIVAPVGYVDMIQLVAGSDIVFTDSGGLQKEAVYLRKPCVVLRKETEWKMLEQQNFLKTVSRIECHDIISAAKSKFNTAFNLLPDPSNVSLKICEKIREYHGKSFNRH